MPVLLIVTLLAGHPGVSLVCEFWCTTAAAETHHRAVACHHTADAVRPGEQVIAPVAECHDAPVVTAFVNEARQPDIPAVTMVSTVPGTLAALVHRDVAHEGWTIFGGQSSRPPVFRTILRV